MKYLALILFMILFGCKETEVETNIVSPEEMQTLLQIENIQLVDVRTADEYQKGFIPNAINIDFLSPTFSEEINKLDKDKPIIVYCHKGGRSAQCSEKLVDFGFKKIYDLEGGYSKWQFEREAKAEN